MRKGIHALILFSALALVPAARAGRFVRGNAALKPIVGLSVGAGSLNPLQGEKLDLDSGLGGLASRNYALEIEGAASPAAAKAFLDDKETRAWLQRNSPKRHRELFFEAAGLEDLRLTLDTYEDPDLLRLALIARYSIEQARSPQALLAWIDSDPTLAPYRSRATAAFLEWETLEAQQRKGLEENDLTAEIWAPLSLHTRQEAFRILGKHALQKVRFGLIPRNRDEAVQQGQVLSDTLDIFDNNERYDLIEKHSRGIITYNKLREARKALEELSDTELMPLLTRAEEQTDPEEALQLLSQIFDQIGVADTKEIARVRVKKSFTPQQREALSRFLNSNIFAEVAGTQAGEMLKKFYAGHALKIDVEPIDGAATANYDPRNDRIIFNERIANTFLNERGLTIETFLQDSNALHDFIALIAPTFVHEATHQTQIHAISNRGMPPKTGNWYDTMMEAEAYSREVLYREEKGRMSEHHRLLFIAGAEMMDDTHGGVDRAKLLHDDQKEFQRHVLGAYSKVNSLPGMARAWLHHGQVRLKENRETRQVISAELRRRKGLSPRAQTEHEDKGTGWLAWTVESENPIATIKTSALRGAQRFNDEDQTWVYEIYDYLQTRYQTTKQEVMNRIQDIGVVR
ncbi:MAG: hypothetical protein COB53_07645 [Elusimicrobia bacterium]|nr:MAG: hypothetical protein COB53_07645 [Elusimicrobiota bacterium]